MSHIINKPIPKLHKAPQPPLSYPGATPDSDRAKNPSLAEPPARDQELRPGDRVEGLGNFGKPTGEFGTVEQSNEEDAIVKWDDDGRKRLHQLSLKKVQPATKLSRPTKFPRPNPEATVREFYRDRAKNTYASPASEMAIWQSR